MGEEVFALVERSKPKRRDVRAEVTDRMRLERRDDYRAALMEGALDGAVHHRLVAEMETVEIAECDDAPLQIVGDAAGESEPLHYERA